MTVQLKPLTIQCRSISLTLPALTSAPSCGLAVSYEAWLSDLSVRVTATRSARRFQFPNAFALRR